MKTAKRQRGHSKRTKKPTATTVIPSKEGGTGPDFEKPSTSTRSGLPPSGSPGADEIAKLG